MTKNHTTYYIRLQTALLARDSRFARQRTYGYVSSREPASRTQHYNFRNERSK